MTEGVQQLSAEFIRQAVSAAVIGEIGRSALIPQALQENVWSGTRLEVVQLRRVVANQAEQIAELQARLDQAQQEVHRLETRELVVAVVDALRQSATGFDGYVIDDAHVEVKAAMEFDNGRLTMTADPGGLLDTNSLSTFDVHLRALPPPLGEPSLPQSLAAVGMAGEQLQAALDGPGLEPAARAAALRAVADLLAMPGEPGRWALLGPVLETVAAADPRVGDSGRSAAAAAAGVAAGMSARSLDDAARALRLLAVDLGQLRA
ncbi:hypothetical protein [Frankia sp. Cr2]|uniref:hypothetical protein n=1 Tax=Frankia sp. Cr2 TaxID=3073932 RepID=UPI002AD242F2|nr:hypothetical protein [Frankia sp. Cr2]